MKELLKKYKSIIIWSSIAVIVMPLLIHILYKIKAPVEFLVAEWSAGELLSFYGSLLGAIATIIALTLTINFTRENQREERKLSTRPYLQASKSYYMNFDNIPMGTDVTYVEVRNGVMEYQNGAFDEIVDIINPRDKQSYVGVTDESIYKERVSDYLKDRYLIYYEIKNCGAGNAINVHFNINDSSVMSNFCVTTTEPQKIMFVLNRELITSTKGYKIILTLTYYDSASLGKYYQKEEFVFTKNSLDELMSFQEGSLNLTAPVELMKD